jgi:hypothetical protein
MRKQSRSPHRYFDFFSANKKKHVKEEKANKIVW